jgi:uncharacterized protein (DUF1810 family)
MNDSDSAADCFNLQRFVEAQDGEFDQALAEIRRGRKSSHWMWFIFPQIAGLGSSAMSQQYAISGLLEAEAYLAHPVVGPRLKECAEAAIQVPAKTARDIFGSPDDMKLRSSATLFSRVSPADSVFHRLLDRFFDGEPDRQTLEILETQHKTS